MKYFRWGSWNGTTWSNNWRCRTFHVKFNTNITSWPRSWSNFTASWTALLQPGVVGKNPSSSYLKKSCFKEIRPNSGCLWKNYHPIFIFLSASKRFFLHGIGQTCSSSSAILSEFSKTDLIPRITPSTELLMKPLTAGMLGTFPFTKKKIRK